MLESKGTCRTFGSSVVVARKIRMIQKRAELLISSLSHETATAVYNEAVKHACQLVNHTPYFPGSDSCPAGNFKSDYPLPTFKLHFGETVMPDHQPDDILYEAIFVGQERSKELFRVFSPKQKPSVNSVKRVAADFGI